MPKWDKYLAEEDRKPFERIVRHKRRMVDVESVIEKQSRKEREESRHEEKRTANREEV
jgi:hypothetical protein